MKALHVVAHVALVGICGCMQARPVPPQREPSLPVVDVEPEPPNPLLVVEFGPHKCPNPVNPGPVNPPANQPVQVRVGPPPGTVPSSPVEAMEGESTLGEVCKYESAEADSLVMRDLDWRGGKVVRRTSFNLHGGDCRHGEGPCDLQSPVYAVLKDPCDHCAELNATAVDKAKSASGLFARIVTGGLVRSLRTMPLMQYDLRESQDKALLTVTAHGDDLKDFKKLKPVWSRRYVGERVEESQRTITLYLHALDALPNGAYFLDDDAKTMEISCRQTQLSIAASDAILVPKVSAASLETECGDSSAVWQPDKRRERGAYLCSVERINGKRFDPDFASIAFTPDQSIERVEVNNDCMMQGGGYRLAPTAAQVARMHATGDGY